MVDNHLKKRFNNKTEILNIKTIEAIGTYNKNALIAPPLLSAIHKSKKTSKHRAMM